MGWRRQNDYYRNKKRKRRKPQDGRKFERRVQRILQTMLDKGWITDFERYEPFSPEDHAGKDFSVTLILGSRRVTREFGITMSRRRLGHSQKLHPDVPQIYMPYESTDWQIKGMIIILFAERTRAKK